MTPIDHDDPDIAQATMFLGVLLAEIDTLSGRIDTAEAQARAADTVDRGAGQRRRADAQKLRTQLYEVHSRGGSAGVPVSRRARVGERFALARWTNLIRIATGCVVDGRGGRGQWWRGWAPARSRAIRR